MHILGTICQVHKLHLFDVEEPNSRKVLPILSDTIWDLTKQFHTIWICFEGLTGHISKAAVGPFKLIGSVSC